MAKLMPAACGTLVCAMTIGALAWPANAQIFGPVKTPQPSPFVVGRMGIEMSEVAARHGVAFAVFTPPRQIVAVALLPPFHGDDVRAYRGIGIEYTDAHDRRYALSEWPANGGNLDSFEALENTLPGCADAHNFSRGGEPSGIVWSTPRGLIMSLQPDGKNDARTLLIEWKKLVQRGGCR